MSRNTDAPWRDKELLHQKYVVEGKGLREIADEWGCTKGTVYRWKKKFGIVRNPPWKDKETLERLYVDEGLSGEEIAEKLGCGRDPVYYHLNKFDIPIREGGQHTSDAPWKDEKELHQLYHEKGLSTHAIADRFGVAQTTITRQMDKYGIDRRSPNQDKPPYYHTTPLGYEQIQTTVGQEKLEVFVHELVAIANGADPYKVLGNNDYVCHHRNEITWDNRPVNIQVMPRGEHQSMHMTGHDPEIV